MCISHLTMLPKIAHVIKVHKPPGESGLQCSLRDLIGQCWLIWAHQWSAGTHANPACVLQAQLACPKGAQMLLQRQVQVPSLRAGC